MYLAAMSGNLAELNLVVEFAPERINEPNSDGRTPLHDVAQTGRRDAAVSLLLSAKADVNKTDNYGWTPLSKRCTPGHGR